LNSHIAIGRTADKLTLEVILPLDRLSLTEPRAPRRLALSAVIEDENGRRSYWALKHALAQPGFHHPEVFALEIERWDGSVSFY
jgi:hypothetical protein